MFTSPDTSGGIINTIFALVFAVNLVAILWGISIYYAEFGSDEGKKEGKDFIIKSVTILFLLMCLYALVVWVRNLVVF